MRILFNWTNAHSVCVKKFQNYVEAILFLAFDFQIFEFSFSSKACHLSFWAHKTQNDNKNVGAPLLHVQEYNTWSQNFVNRASSGTSTCISLQDPLQRKLLLGWCWGNTLCPERMDTLCPGSATVAFSLFRFLSFCVFGSRRRLRLRTATRKQRMTGTTRTGTTETDTGTGTGAATTTEADMQVWSLSKNSRRERKWFYLCGKMTGRVTDFILFCSIKT